MSPSALRFLLVEDDLDELCLFQELITELIEPDRRRGGVALDFLHALDFAEAQRILDQTDVDLVLLDSSLPDSTYAHSLAILRAQHADTPVVVLADDNARLEDQVQMIRLGAQDVIPHADVDCLPLLRSAQFAIERHKLSSALRTITYMDELTGLYNHAGFLEVGFHVMALARKLEQPALLIALTPAGSVAMIEDPDLALIETADLMRTASDPSYVLARWDRDVFLALIPRGTAVIAARFHERLEQARLEMATRTRLGRPPLTLRCGQALARLPLPLDDLVALARESLCENEDRPASARA